MTSVKLTHDSAENLWRFRRHLCLLSFYVQLVFWAVADIWSVPDPVQRYLILLPATYLVALWVICDVRLRHTPQPWILYELLYFAYPLGVLIYLTSTRGWKGLRLFLLNVLVCMAVYLAVGTAPDAFELLREWSQP